MSIVIKTRRARPKTWSASIMWVVLGLATIFFLVIYGQQLLLENDLKQKIAVQRSENSAIEDANTRLKASLQYYQSDKYIEQRAREDLNLRRGDEEVLIPIKEEARRQEAEGGRQEAGGRRQEAGGGRQEAGGGRQEAGGGRQGWLSLFSPPANAP